jgi:hypothetical protein
MENHFPSGVCEAAMTPDDAAWLLCGGSLDSAAAHLPEEFTSAVEFWHRNRAPSESEVSMAVRRVLEHPEDPFALTRILGEWA